MAFAVLNGTTATVDITFGSSPVSVKCIYGRARVTPTRRTFEQITFCSGGWVVEIAGMRQVIVDLGGYVSVGNTYSDPLALILTSVPTVFTVQFDTATTVSGAGNTVSDPNEIIAAGNSSRDTQIRSSGACISVWPIT